MVSSVTCYIIGYWPITMVSKITRYIIGYWPIISQVTRAVIGYLPIMEPLPNTITPLYHSSQNSLAWSQFKIPGVSTSTEFGPNLLNGRLMMVRVLSYAPMISWYPSVAKRVTSESITMASRHTWTLKATLDLWDTVFQALWVNLPGSRNVRNK